MTDVFADALKYRLLSWVGLLTGAYIIYTFFQATTSAYNNIVMPNSMSEILHC